MPTHRSTPSEALPLKERMHRPSSSLSANPPLNNEQDPDVSPFADPGAASLNPFADPSTTALPRAPTPAAQAPTSTQTGRLPTGVVTSYADSAPNFAPYEEPTSPGLRTKESAPRSPMSPKGARKAGYWDMDGSHARQRRRKLLFFSGIAVLLMIVIAIVVGVVLGKKKSSSSGSSGPGPLEGTAGAVSFTNPSNPSTYAVDGNLRNVFYGIDYIPLGAYPPQCGITQNNVTEDIVLLSQLTTRVRMYAGDCGQAGMVLNAIQQTGVGLEVYLAVNLTLNTTSFYEQTTAVAEALREYGTDHVAGVVVGNQFIASYLASHNASDPNSQPGQNAASYVSSQLASMRATLSALNLPKPVPVGTADGGTVFTPLLLQEVDFAMASFWPWRMNIIVGDAAGWTVTEFKDYALSTAQATSSSPPMYIGAIGWPSLPSSTTSPPDPPPATPQALQTLLDTFVCGANQNGTGYFWYEAFDEVWREEAYGGVEGGWGLFTSDKQLKNITLPSCSHS